MLKKARLKIRSIIQNQRGQGLVEYSLILALVVIGLVVIVTQVGGKVLGLYNWILTSWP